MKLIANITLEGKAGKVKPGEEIDVKDAKEARSLIARGFAHEPIKVAAKPAEGADGAGDTGAAKPAEGADGASDTGAAK